MENASFRIKYSVPAGRDLIAGEHSLALRSYEGSEDSPAGAGEGVGGHLREKIIPRKILAGLKEAPPLKLTG